MESLKGISSRDEIAPWLQAASHGDKVVYYRGDLATDRTPSLLDSDFEKGRKNKVNQIGTGAYVAAQYGLVDLVQYRDPINGRFDYIMRRTSREWNEAAKKEISSTGKVEKTLPRSYRTGIAPGTSEKGGVGRAWRRSNQNNKPARLPGNAGVGY
jgi:hypothetical protein